MQDPDEAIAPSMPVKAIPAVEVDDVLPAEQIGPKFVELAPTQSAEKIQVIPNGDKNMSATGQTYSCPECGGVLEEAKEGGMLRFRCRGGHLYSPDSLSGRSDYGR